MKALVLILSFISNYAMAADVYLRAGESTLIRSNVPTQVYCESGSSGGGNPMNCQQALDELNYTLEACETGILQSSCIKKYWPEFRYMYPQCAKANIELCMDKCSTGTPQSQCIDICR